MELLEDLDPEDARAGRRSCSSAIHRHVSTALRSQLANLQELVCSAPDNSLLVGVVQSIREEATPMIRVFLSWVVVLCCCAACRTDCSPVAGATLRRDSTLPRNLVEHAQHRGPRGLAREARVM